MCKLEKNSNIYVSNIHLSNLIEILSKVGKIDVITPDNTAMITFDQPMAAFAAVNWYDGYQGMSVEFAKI